MEQWMAGRGGTLQTAATSYYKLDSANTTATATISDTQTIITTPGVFYDLFIQPNGILTNANSSYTISLNVNGLSTPLQCVTTTALATYPIKNTTDRVRVKPGDLVCFQSVPLNGPNARSMGTSIVFESDIPKESILFGSMQDNLPASTTEYNQLQGGLSWVVSGGDDRLSKQIMPCNGVIKNLYVNVVTAPGAAKEFVFAIMVNSVATAVTCTINGAVATSASDVVHSVAVVTGDFVSIECNPNGTPAVSYCVWSTTFVAENDGETPCLFATSNTLNPAATEYNTIYSNPLNWTTAGGGVHFFYIPIRGKPLIFKNLIVSLSAAPGTGAGEGYTIGLNNSSDTALTNVTVTLTDAQVLVSTTASVRLERAAEGGFYNTQCAVASGVPVAVYARVSYVKYVQPEYTINCELYGGKWGGVISSLRQRLIKTRRMRGQ